MAKKNVTTWFLELPTLSQLTRSNRTIEGLSLIKVEKPCPEYSAFFFQRVGGLWRWYSRLGWSYLEWLEYLQKPTVETWVGYVDGAPIGYIELMKHDDNSVEVMFFGLLPWALGKGWGGPWLEHAIERGFAFSADRVWLHTCDQDHPSALGNYQKRGFELKETKTDVEDYPEDDAINWLMPNLTISMNEFFDQK